jgi:glyoxylase-like metal-dependent hydrolase (beta-lactamase superfamily II)
MKEIMLKEQFYMYQFTPLGERVLGQNIFVLYEGKQCIVFDAGYEAHMKQLLPILDKYNIKNVICTHFHPDHCYGLNVLPKQHLIGSKYALETLDMFDDLNNDLLIPSLLIEEKTVLQFGSHIITMTPNPGHSNCEMLIDIDGEFVLIGDEYMTTNDNQPVLPYVAATIEQHKHALLNIIENYKGYTYLPSHGAQTNSVEDLNYRIRYLDFAATKEKDIKLFYKKDDIPFLSERWHISNIRR